MVPQKQEKLFPPMKQSVNMLERSLKTFQSALFELKALVKEMDEQGRDEKYEQKLIRSFEVTHELALATMGEFFKNQGRPPYSGPRDITVDAFHEELIDDGEGWLDMIIIRIKTSPIYHEDTTNTLVEKIRSQYLGLLENFFKKISDRHFGNIV